MDIGTSVGGASPKAISSDLLKQVLKWHAKFGNCVCRIVIISIA